MRKIYALLAAFLAVAPLVAHSQTSSTAAAAGTMPAASPDVWTLQRCVEYALSHNLTIQQSVLEERLARLTLTQSRLSQLPNINGNASYGKSYGRTIDPTTNEFTMGGYQFSALNANADVLLFGWFQKRNAIASNRLVAQAAAANRSQIQSDVSLNVATGFLRALLAWEQMVINKKQVELSNQQVLQMRQSVAAGVAPELNVALLEAQVAADSAAYIASLSAVNNAILEMKALLNLDFDTKFVVVPPDANAAIDRAKLASLSPEIIYAEASQTFGSLQNSKFRLEASRKRLAAIRGALLPQLSAAGQLATYYTSNARNAVITGYQSGSVANTYVDVNGSQTPVYQNSPVFTTSPVAFGNQFDRNFQQTVALNLTVPLFNAWQGQYAVRRARLSVQSQELGQDLAEQKLRQEIYKVYEEARNAVQTLAAAQRSLDAARRAYDFASQRYSAGLANTVEFLNFQASRTAAEARFLGAKYDLLFKLKMIDYYMGKPLVL